MKISNQTTTIYSGKRCGIRVVVVGFITLLTVALLWPFFTGLPGKALAQLWGNPYELKNAATIGCVLALMASATAISRRQTPFVIVLLAAIMLTVGPAASIVALIVSFCSVSVGFQFLGSKGISSAANSYAARLAIAFWLGKSMYLLCLSLLSGFPINTRFLHGIILFATLFTCRRGARDALKVINTVIFNYRYATGWSFTFVRFLLHFSILLAALATLHPFMDGDAMTMHMRIAREMLLSGAWGYDVTQYVFSVMPLGPQLNFSAMFLLGSVEAVKAELFLQFLTLLTLVACGGISSSSRIGMAIATVFAGLPMFFREISGLYVDLTLCGFALAAVVLMTSAVRRRSRNLILMALFCAAGAMASKVHGVFVVTPIVIVAVPLWFFSKPITAPNNFRSFLIFCAALVLASFFYVIAWWKTGNPVFPFMNGLFHSPNWHLYNFSDNRWTGHMSWEIPWHMTFESSLFEESVDGSMGILVMFLCLCSFGLLFLPKVGLVGIIPLLFGVFYLFSSCTQSQYLRYLLPGFFMVGTGLVFALRWSFGKVSPALWYPAILALLIANIVGMPSGRIINGLFHIPLANYLQAGSYRGMPSLNFQEETVNGHRYISNYLNSSTRSLPTILMLGCPYGAYFNGRTIYTTWHNFTWVTLEPQLLDATEFDRYLANNQVSHIVVDPATFQSSRKEFVPLVLSRSRLIAELWGVQLYEVTHDVEN